VLEVAIVTLGCKVNQYESAAMAGLLQAAGCRLVPFYERAEVYIINTCTVTAKADYESRQLIRRAERQNDKATIIVTGCYAQVAPQEVASLPGVCAVVGNREKSHIVNLLFRENKGSTSVFVSNLREEILFNTPSVLNFPGRTRAFLKIQDGCDNFCTYCIVPFARGRGRSLPITEVISRLRALTQVGYREVVLTGVNLSAYGRDLKPTVNLLSLLQEMAKEKNLPRIRLSSLEPREITEELLAFIKENPWVCPHFHIPFQSGDDRILSLMGRDYGGKFFEELVERIVAHLPEAAIGLDVMVGFPGENEQAFLNTLRMIERLPVSYLHVFPYSPRPMTGALKLPDQVSAGEKKKRALLLRDLGRKKREVFLLRYLGKELTILLEGGKKKSGWQLGRTANYLPVLVDTPQSKGNTLLSVRAVAVEGDKIKGVVLS